MQVPPIPHSVLAERARSLAMGLAVIVVVGAAMVGADSGAPTGPEIGSGLRQPSASHYPSASPSVGFASDIPSGSASESSVPGSSTGAEAASATPLATAAPTPGATPPPTPNPTAIPGWQPAFPIRAAFYYPWFPESWKQQGMDPFTQYHPSLGLYDSSSASVIHAHIGAMQYGGISVGISSWWGQGTPTDARLPSLLAAVGSAHFRWTVYYEPEGETNPGVQQIRDDLAYLAARYGSNPAYLRIGGRFVVFVYGGGDDSCATADRWAEANSSVHAYIVLKVFSGYQTCAQQPDGWHQYGPASADSPQAGYSYSISPGFYKGTEPSPRLPRDVATWANSVRAMVGSGAPWQLITTFNEWGEGTSVESATEWETGSGFGAYLDALHTNGT